MPLDLVTEIKRIKEELKDHLMFNKEMVLKIGDEKAIELRRDADLRLAYGIFHYIECLIEFNSDK